jgi:hypothetical protein
MTARTLLVLVTLWVTGCTAGTPSTVSPSWPLRNVKTQPADVAVLSGTEFRCGGVPCRLLGVRESDSPAVREEAAKFTQMWFKSIGNYIGFYNGSNPLVDKDGTAVVWVRGYDMYLSCLNEELVRTGLVGIDDGAWDGYTFTEPTKESERVEDWRGDLRKAREGHARGEKPHVLFDWPPR